MLGGRHRPLVTRRQAFDESLLVQVLGFGHFPPATKESRTVDRPVPGVALVLSGGLCVCGLALAAKRRDPSR